MAGKGNPKGTNRGGGRRSNTTQYHPLPNGTVWAICKKHCKRVGWMHHTGYEYFTMGNKRVATHRYIAEAFLPNPNNYQFVDHINRVRHDNRVENLRWVDRKTNNDNRCFGSPEAMVAELTKLGYTIIPPE